MCTMCEPCQYWRVLIQSISVARGPRVCGGLIGGWSGWMLQGSVLPFPGIWLHTTAKWRSCWEMVASLRSSPWVPYFPTKMVISFQLMDLWSLEYIVFFSHISQHVRIWIKCWEGKFSCFDFEENRVIRRLLVWLAQVQKCSTFSSLPPSSARRKIEFT